LHEITLAKTLKVKNRLAKVQADIHAYNSVPDGQADQVTRGKGVGSLFVGIARVTACHLCRNLGPRGRHRSLLAGAALSRFVSFLTTPLLVRRHEPNQSSWLIPSPPLGRRIPCALIRDAKAVGFSPSNWATLQGRPCCRRHSALPGYWPRSHAADLGIPRRCGDNATRRRCAPHRRGICALNPEPVQR